MGAYILRRLLLIVPTLLGIMIVNFALVQFVPGGPVEQAIARAQGQGDVFGSFAGNEGDGTGGGSDLGAPENDQYIGARGLPPEFIEQLEKEFGFDKPPLERFLNMMWNYIRFDFGESYFQSRSVVDLVIEKLPVSISLGLWSTLIAYIISIPLGIRKAVRDGAPLVRFHRMVGQSKLRRRLCHDRAATTECQVRRLVTHFHLCSPGLDYCVNLRFRDLCGASYGSPRSRGGLGG